MLPYLILLFALLLLSAYFSSSETAFLSLQRVQLEHRVRAGANGAERVARLLDRPHTLLSAILLGNNLVNTAAAAVGTVIATRLLPGGEAVLGATIAVTVLLVLFGEVGPKTMALSHSWTVSRLWSPPMLIWTRLTRPVTIALDALTRLLLRLFGNPQAVSSASLDVAELRTAIRLGVESGALEVNASNRLIGALMVQQRKVQEIMCPRVEMVMAEVDEPLRDVAERLATHGFLRLPVYEDNPDEVVGYVHVSDLNQAHLKGIDRLTVRDLMRPPLFESEHSSIARVLALMQERGSYMVMLADEFGVTSGLVTLEDVLEEMVGALPSESGAEPEQPVRDEDGRREVEGSHLLVDLSNDLDVDLTEIDANTVAGLVLAYTHRFPKPGEYVEHAGVRFTVLEVDERRVRRVAVERVPEPARD